jgi:hypothetical protein
MNKLKYWLRWSAVFPGAIIAGLLATFPLHWILYFTLAKGEIISGVDIKPIEYLLYPFVIAVIFVLAGYKIAPKYKFKTAIVLFGLYLIMWLTFSIISLFKGNIYGIDMKFSFRTILSLIGSFVGLFIAKKIQRNKEITNKI